MRTEVFFGTSWTDWALIVAGMHPSELSGIEVADWVGVRLAAAYADGRRPKFSTLLITELFPQDTAASREYEWKQRSGAAGRRRPRGDASEDHTKYRNLVRDSAGNPVEPAQSKQAMQELLEVRVVSEWDVKVPTTQVYLQQDATLPGQGTGTPPSDL